MEPLLAEQARERMRRGKAPDPMATLPQGPTRDHLGEMAGVGGRTLDKAKVIVEEADEVTTQQLRQGERREWRNWRTPLKRPTTF
jgi:hypothetical protein